MSQLDRPNCTFQSATGREEQLDQEQTVRQVFGEIACTGATGLLAIDLTAAGDEPEAIALGTTKEIKATSPAGTKTQDIRPDNISLRTALLPQALAMIFRRRPSSSKSVSDGSPPVRTFVVCWNPQMGYAGLQAPWGTFVGRWDCLEMHLFMAHFKLIRNSEAFEGSEHGRLVHPMRSRPARRY